MALIKKLLPHQGKFLQSPFLYPELRFFFLVCGYGAGKTSILVDSLLYWIDYLQDKKDLSGKRPMIMFASKNLTFMKKTGIHDLIEALDNTNTQYSFHKDINQIEVGNVTIILQPAENPDDIYGANVCLTKGHKVMTSKGYKDISDMKVGDTVYTRQGFKRITHTQHYRNKRTLTLIFENGHTIVCTPEHRLYDDSVGKFVMAKDLISFSSCAKLVNGDVSTLLDIKVNEKLEDVYDITVEDAHEFFVRNGDNIPILSSNCIVFFDEMDELPTEVSLEAIRSLNERLRQQLVGVRPPFMMITSTAQGKKGMYQAVTNFKNSGVPYMLIRGATKDNIYLPDSYVKAMYAMYNENERKCYLEGQFLNVDSNMVFPDYDPDVNDLDVDLWDSISPSDTVYIGADFNNSFNHAVAGVVLKNCIVLIKDYVVADARRAPEVYRYDFPDNRIVWIPDMTYKEHFGEFKKELWTNHIEIAYRACNPVINDRLFAVNKCMKAQRLFICPICTETKKSLKNHQRDPKTGRPTKGGINAPDHHSDVISYLTHYLLTWRKELKDVYDYTLGRRYRYSDDPAARLGDNIIPAASINAKTIKRLGSVANMNAPQG